MTNQLDAAFEVIAVDRSRAYFLDNTFDGAVSFEEFEVHSGLSRTDLEQADRTKATVFIPADDRHYTVDRMPTVAELRAEGKLKPFDA